MELCQQHNLNLLIFFRLIVHNYVACLLPMPVVYGSWLTAASQPERLVVEWLGQNENSKQTKFHLDMESKWQIYMAYIVDEESYLYYGIHKK